MAKKYRKQKKVTVQTLIISLIGMLFLIIILDKFFVALFNTIEMPEIYAHLVSFVVPGAGEIINYIIPFLKQNKIMK